jgi:pimeloyl-ACP methyl ester carboxylesterase
VSIRWILLPGMDGVGRFRSFQEALGTTEACRPLSYPPREPLGYDVLTEYVRSQLRDEAEYILVAESFSGPIAIRLAAERPPGLRALVLAASFCASPVRGLRRILLRVAKRLLFRRPPPLFLVEYFLLGHGASRDLIDDLYASLAQVDAQVFHRRLDEVLTVNVCAQAARIEVPILYLQGRSDHLVGACEVRVLTAACPRIELHQVDAPHMVLQRQPEQALAAIRAFLARHKLAARRP